MNSAALSLRPARASDVPAIGALKVAAWRRAYAGILPAEALDGLDVARESADWGAYAGNPPADDRLIVACLGSTVVGYGRSEPSPDVDVQGGGEVAGLYVHPDAQVHGIGTAMLNRLVDDLTARGFEPIVLWHFVGNDRAARFYRRFGFHPDGGRRPVPGLAVDEVRLRLAHPVG